MNDKQETIAGCLILAYIAFCVFTFGHAFNNTQRCDWSENALTGCRAFIGSFAALFAPLYWSAELQKKEPTNDKPEREDSHGR